MFSTINPFLLLSFPLIAKDALIKLARARIEKIIPKVITKVFPSLSDIVGLFNPSNALCSASSFPVDINKESEMNVNPTNEMIEKIHAIIINIFLAFDKVTHLLPQALYH